MNFGISWTEFSKQYSDYTFFWQDLDGGRLTCLPKTAPLTSIMWGWRSSTGESGQTGGLDLVRVRLDGDQVFVAEMTYRSGEGEQGGRRVELQPWAPDDKRVSQARLPDLPNALEGLRITQYHSSDPELSSVVFFHVEPAKIGANA